MIMVTLSFPNGRTREVLLAGVPREGETIRLANGVEAPSLIVEHVLWNEGSDRGEEPTVLVVVRQRDEKPGR